MDDDASSEIEYHFPSVNNPDAAASRTLKDAQHGSQPTGNRAMRTDTTAVFAQEAAPPFDQSTNTALHRPMAADIGQPVHTRPQQSMNTQSTLLEPRPFDEVRMRDADLNVHYNIPVAEFVEITSALPPTTTLNGPRDLPSAQMKPFAILKPSKPYQGGHGRPYVGLAPSPLTPYERDPEAAAMNSRIFCATDEANRRRQHFHAGNKYQSTPPNPVYVQQTPPADFLLQPNNVPSNTADAGYESRLPWSWEIERGADPNTLIKPSGISLTEQVRLCEEEEKRLKKGRSQDSHHTVPPQVQKVAQKADQSTSRTQSLFNTERMSTSTSAVSDAISRLRTIKPNQKPTSTSSKTLFRAHPYFEPVTKPLSASTNTSLQSQSNSHTMKTQTLASSNPILKSDPNVRMGSESTTTPSVNSTLPLSSIPAKRLSRPNTASWKAQASSDSGSRLHPHLSDQHAVSRTTPGRSATLLGQGAARTSGVKRPSPSEDEGEQQEKDQSSLEPSRRIGGTFASIWGYVPRFFTTLFGLFHARPQEILAVETNSSGRKRRAIADESLSNNTSAVMTIPEVPGNFPRHSADDSPLKTVGMQPATAMSTQTGTPPASRPSSTDDMRPSGLVNEALQQSGQAHDNNIDWRGKAPAANTTENETDADIDMIDAPGPTTAIPATSLNSIASHFKSPVGRTRLTQSEETKINHSIERIKTQQEWFRRTGQRNDFMDRQTYPDYKKRLQELDSNMGPADAASTMQRSPPGQHYGVLWRYKALQRGGTIPEDIQRDNAEGKPRFDREAQVNSLVERARKAAISHKQVLDLEKSKAADLRKARQEAEQAKAAEAARKAEAAARKAEEKLRLKQERKENEQRRKAEEQARFEEWKQQERALEALALSPDKGKLIPPLNAKWAQKLAEAMEVKNEAQVLATSVAGVNLTRRDLGRLLPPPPAPGTRWSSTAPWLNDEAVNAWLATIVTSKLEQAGYKRGVGTPPYVAFNSAWYTNYRSKGMSSIANWARRQKIAGTKLLTAERIFFPVNTGAHWILLIVSPRDRKLEVLDSAHGRAAGYFRAMREWLSMELGKDYNADDWTEATSSVSQPQLNMDDCGVFVCVNALASAKNRDFSDVESSDGMLDARRTICAVLINGGFSGDWEL